MMMVDEAAKPRVMVRAWLLAGWATIAAIWILAYGWRPAGGPLNRFALLTGLGDTLGWMLLCWGGIAVAGRADLRGRGLGYRVATIALATALLTALRFVLLYALEPYMGWTIPPDYVARLFPVTWMSAGAFVGLGYGIRAGMRRREEERSAARLEAEVARARFATARSQLAPGFLIDALATIAEQVPRDGAAADERLIELCELLRLAFQRAAESSVPLGAEREFVGRYLEYQGTVRAPVHLEYRVAAEEAERPVPHTFLFTPIESVLRMAPPELPLAFTVTSGTRDGGLLIHLCDDLPLTVSQRRALAPYRAVEAMAAALPGGDAAAPLEVADLPGGGVRTTLHLAPGWEEERAPLPVGPDDGVEGPPRAASDGLSWAAPPPGATLRVRDPTVIRLLLIFCAGYAAVLAASRYYLGVRFAGTAPSFGVVGSLALGARNAAAWGALCLAAFRLASWRPVKRVSDAAAVGAAAALLVPCFLIFQRSMGCVLPPTIGECDILGEPAGFFLSFPQIFPVTLGFVAAGYAAAHAQGGHQRELRAQRLRAELARARIVKLNMQLRPHFLFNTLQSASTLMRRDPGAAVRMLARLGELLRSTIHDDEIQEVELRQELALLAVYTGIEEVRFSDRLRVSVDAAPAALHAPVPRFVLQPLVENSIRHAVATSPSPVRIVVSAAVDGGTLRMSVSDDGPGVAPGGAAGGVGLANTRARLRVLYGDAHTLALSETEGGGLTVTLDIPFRPCGGDTGSAGRG